MAAISLGRVCLNRRRRISSVLLRLGCLSGRKVGSCPAGSTLIRMDQPNRRWMMWLLPSIRSGCIWWLGFWGNRSSGLEDISRSFEAERVRRLGVFDERKGYVLFDHPSTVSFLRHNARMSGYTCQPARFDGPDGGKAQIHISLVEARTDLHRPGPSTVPDGRADARQVTRRRTRPPRNRR